MSDPLDQAVALIREWYTIPGNDVGGAFHIVLDDGNVEAHHIVWCADQLDEWTQSYAPEMGATDDDIARMRFLAPRLTAALLALTEDERANAINAYHRSP